MATYPAPTETLTTFNPAVFETNDVPLTITEGSKYFLKYPLAQGAETFSNISVAGITTLSNKTTLNYTTIPTLTFPNDIGSSSSAVINYPTTLAPQTISSFTGVSAGIYQIQVQVNTVTASNTVHYYNILNAGTVVGIIPHTTVGGGADFYCGSLIITIPSGTATITLQTGVGTGTANGGVSLQSVKLIRIA